MIRPLKRLALLFAVLSFAAAPLLLLSRAATALAGMHALDTTQDSAARPMTWSVSGPMGGDARELTVDPSDPNRLLMGTIDGQIYESRDGARTWARLSN